MIIYGRNAVREALKSKWPVKEVRVSQGAEKSLEDVISMAEKKRAPVRSMKKHELARWVESEFHQGIGAVVDMPPDASLKDVASNAAPKSPLIVLDEVEDPRNFGAIIRAARAGGCSGVVVGKDRAAPMSAATVKASAGLVFALPVVRVTNIARSLDELKDYGYWIYGADRGSAQSLYTINWADKAVFVFGGEGEGIRSLVRQKCDILFEIPMAAGVDSLNVSMAAGVSIFEYRRRFPA